MLEPEKVVKVLGRTECLPRRHIDFPLQSLQQMGQEAGNHNVHQG